MLGNLQQAVVLPLVGSTARGIASSAAAANIGLMTTPVAAFLLNNRVTTPMNEALMPVNTTERPSNQLAKAPSLQTDSLQGGARIACMASPSPLASLAVYVDAGSANESLANAGVSRLLQHAAFKATVNRSTFRVTREIEKIGALPAAHVGRESMCFSLDFVKSHAPDAAEVLLDSVLCAKFNPWEVKELMPAVKEAVAAALQQPGVVLSDLLHKAAFAGGLSNASCPDVSLLGRLGQRELLEFAAQVLHPAKMTVAAAGLELADVKPLLEPMLSTGAAAPKANASSSYQGGFVVGIAATEQTHVAVAFEAAGGNRDAKAAACAKVVAELLRGKDGRVLHARHEKAAVPTAPLLVLHNATGLLGASAAVDPADVPAAVDALAKKFDGLAKSVTEGSLKAAKASVVLSHKATMASSKGVVDEIARQLMASGKFDAAAPVAAVQGLTVSDVTAYISKMLKGKPTFVAYGQLASAPRYEDFAKRFA